MNELQFFIPGKPEPGGSKRGFFNKKLGRVMITESNPKCKGWRASVAEAGAAASKEVLDGPLKVRFQFLFVRPKGHFRKDGTVRPGAPAFPDVRPDCSKVVRSTEDALKGITWRDDSQIVTQMVTKRYGEQAGCWITVRREAA